MELKHNMMVFLFFHCKLNTEYPDKYDKNKWYFVAKYAWPLFVFAFLITAKLYSFYWHLRCQSMN